MNDTGRSERKSTQRERLLRAMRVIAVDEGYAETTIAKVIAEAGVSRPTFYEYFSDKEDCFIATQREIAGRLLEQLRAAVEGQPAQRAVEGVIRTLVAFAGESPLEARLLLCGALAAGPRALDERDRIIGETVAIIEQARAGSKPSAPTADLPLWTLIGAVNWLLSRRLRSGEQDLGGLAEGLTCWAESYERPLSEHRWRTLEPGALPPASPFLSELPSGPPAILPPGRPRLSREEVARNQRERILYATAELASRKGYNATSIAEIIASAGLDTRVFYSHFAEKQQAFLAAHELGFQHTMAVAAGAFFSAESWPERTWQGILAGTQFQASHPTLTHVLYVQSYAIGAPAVQRIDDTHAAFTIFLQEGNQQATEPLSQIAMEAIVAASFEIAFRLSREGRGEEMPGLAALSTYLCLAPFLGADAASRFVDQKTTDEAPSELTTG
jgi:AcrR family transcriptional regulator